MWTFIATFVAVAYEALRQAASVESDPRSWVEEPGSITVCIRPRREEAVRVFGENAA